MRPIALLALASLLHASDQNEILDRLNHAYYSLSDAGLLEFRCQVLPDWPAIDSRMRQTRFDVAVGPTGVATISRHSEVETPDSIEANIAQVLTGFLQTWSLFLHGFPGPRRDKEFKIDEAFGEYRIAQFNVILTVNSDLELTELRTKKPGVIVTIHPKLSQLPSGYLFSGYATTYFRQGSGPVSSHVQIENREVEGFQLPNQVIAVMGASVSLFASVPIRSRSE
jgi:hypothetical protein